MSNVGNFHNVYSRINRIMAFRRFLAFGYGTAVVHGVDWQRASFTSTFSQEVPT